MKTIIKKYYSTPALLLAFGFVLLLLGGLTFVYMNDASGGNEPLPTHVAVTMNA